MLLLVSCSLLVLGGLLAIVSALRIPPAKLSAFELRRRTEAGDKTADLATLRGQYREQVELILRFFIALVVLVMSLVAVWGFGWVWGSLAAVGVVLAAIVLSRPLGATVRRIYRHYERPLLDAIAGQRWLGILVGSRKAKIEDVVVHSRDELSELIEHHAGGLTHDESGLLLNALTFNEQTVEMVMLAVGDVHTVAQSELLGPLVLNDLHQTGYTDFPVLNDRGVVVGVLSISNLLSVDSQQHSVTAGQAMEPDPLFAAPHDRLRHIMQIMLDQRQYMAIVTDKDGAMIGVVTLKAILATLFGK